MTAEHSLHRASIGDSLFDFIQCDEFATYIDKQLDDYLNDDQDIDYDEIERLVERNVDSGEIYNDVSFQEFEHSHFYNLCIWEIYDENREIALNDPMDIYDHVHQALLELEAQDIVEECYDLEDFDEKFSDLSNDEFACSYSDVKAHLEQISVEAKAILEAKEAA